MGKSVTHGERKIVDVKTGESLPNGEIGEIVLRGPQVFVGYFDPAELEPALATHPAVAGVAVVGVPDEKWGEIPRAYIVTKPGQPVAEEELIRFCKEKLASYKAIKRSGVCRSIAAQCRRKAAQAPVEGKRHTVSKGRQGASAPAFLLSP